MDTKEFCVYNKTRENFLSAGVTVIDSVSDPLQVLKVLIEGLADNAETGMWLTPLRRVPIVPRISPFDLVYLDQDRRVLHGVEVLPSAYLSPFDGPADSALLLPIHTLSSSQTHPGDQFVIYEAEESPQPATEPEALTELQSAPLPLELTQPAPENESAPHLVQDDSTLALETLQLVEAANETHALETPALQTHTLRPHALQPREALHGSHTFAEGFSPSDGYDPSILAPLQTDAIRPAKRIKTQAIARTGSSFTMRYLRWADRFVYGPTRKPRPKSGAQSAQGASKIRGMLSFLRARYLSWADSFVYGPSPFRFPRDWPKRQARRARSTPRVEECGD
jgi:hypothetical protein